MMGWFMLGGRLKPDARPVSRSNTEQHRHLKSMAVLRLVGAGIFVFCEPPNNHGRAKAKRQTDWHCENTPKFIHNSFERAGWSCACKARLSWANQRELVALQPAQRSGLCGPTRNSHCTPLACGRVRPARVASRFQRRGSARAARPRPGQSTKPIRARVCAPTWAGMLNRKIASPVPPEPAARWLGAAGESRAG